jgi:hypothetical protein
MEKHTHGLDVLGADFETSEVDTSEDISTPDDFVLGALVPGGLLPGKKRRAIVIQINNAPQLAVAQGGTAGAWASTIAPDTIDQQVYQGAAEQLAGALREKGVDATVKVMDATNWSLDSDDLGAAKYTAMGFAGAGVLGLLGYFWLRKK